MIHYSFFTHTFDQLVTHVNCNIPINGRRIRKKKTDICVSSHQRQLYPSTPPSLPLSLSPPFHISTNTPPSTAPPLLPSVSNDPFSFSLSFPPFLSPSFPPPHVSHPHPSPLPSLTIIQPHPAVARLPEWTFLPTVPTGLHKLGCCGVAAVSGDGGGAGWWFECVGDVWVRERKEERKG